MTSNRLRSFYKDACVYWEVTGLDGFGNPTFLPAIQTSVLWSGNTKQIMNNEGEVTVPQSVIFTSIEMKTGDYLFRGSLTDLTAEQLLDPKKNGDRILTVKDSHSILNVLDKIMEVYL